MTALAMHRYVAGRLREMMGLVGDLALHDTSTLPVVLLTGGTSIAIRTLAHAERCRIASKPLRDDQLFALMHELLRP